MRIEPFPSKIADEVGAIDVINNSSDVSAYRDKYRQPAKGTAESNATVHVAFSAVLPPGRPSFAEREVNSFGFASETRVEAAHEHSAAGAVQETQFHFPGWPGDRVAQLSFPDISTDVRDKHTAFHQCATYRGEQVSIPRQTLSNRHCRNGDSHFADMGFLTRVPSFTSDQAGLF